MDPLAVVAIMELVMKYGPEIAARLVTGLAVNNPTEAQIRALMVHPPQWYFDQATGGN